MKFLFFFSVLKMDFFGTGQSKSGHYRFPALIGKIILYKSKFSLRFFIWKLGWNDLIYFLGLLDYEIW